jgi:hypothetical protein
MQTIPLTEMHYFLLIAAFAAVCGALVGRIIAEETYDRRSAIFFGGYTGAGMGLTAGPPFAVILSLVTGSWSGENGLSVLSAAIESTGLALMWGAIGGAFGGTLAGLFIALLGRIRA